MKKYFSFLLEGLQILLLAIAISIVAISFILWLSEVNL